MATERPILTKVAIGAAFIGGGLSAADLTGFAVRTSDVATREANSAKFSGWAANHLTKAEDALKGLRVTVKGKVYGCNDQKKVETALHHLSKPDGIVGDSGANGSFNNWFYKTDDVDVFLHPSYVGLINSWNKEEERNGELLISGTNPSPYVRFVSDMPFHYDEEDIGHVVTEHMKALFNVQDAGYDTDGKLRQEDKLIASSVKVNGKVCIEDMKGQLSSLVPQIKNLIRNENRYMRNSNSERRKSQEYGFGVVGSAIAFGYGLNRTNLFTRQRKGRN